MKTFIKLDSVDQNYFARPPMWQAGADTDQTLYVLYYSGPKYVCHISGEIESLDGSTSKIRVMIFILICLENIAAFSMDGDCTWLEFVVAAFVVSGVGVSVVVEVVMVELGDPDVP